MTTMTMNASRTAALRAPTYAELRAALPDMPAQGSLFGRTLDVVSCATLAAVPFAAIAWLFIAR